MKNLIEHRQATYQGVTYKLIKHQTRQDKLKGREGRTVWAPLDSDETSDFVFPNEKKFQEIDKAYWPGSISSPDDDYDPAKLSPNEKKRLTDLEIKLKIVPIEDKREVEAKILKLWKINRERKLPTKLGETISTLDEAKRKKKQCPKCYGVGCYYCDYQGFLFAPFFGKGDGTSAAAISTGSGGGGGGPAFPGAGGINAPGVPGGPNSGMGSSMSYDGNSLIEELNAIDRLCKR